SAARLSRGDGGLDSLHWAAVARRPPRRDEIEIAIEAVGLNFRDVMWATRLLPTDILEGGLAGPTLGFECAGRIVRVGSDVRRWRAGERVMAFARSALSTHVTVDAAMAWKAPKGLSAEAAATIPVAFVTAYYSLVHLGKLQKGEWVLIHGGAGGVGLAAIQIAALR